MEVEATLPPGAPPAGTPASEGPVHGVLAAEVARECGLEADAGPGGSVVEPIRKRVGRPPVHGLYSRAAGSDGKHAVAPAGPESGGEAVAGDASPAGPPRRITLPPDLFSRFVGCGLSTGEAFAQNELRIVAQKAGLTPEEIAPQLKQAEFDEKTRALIGELSPLAAEEFGLDTSDLKPSTAILVLIGLWAAGPVSAYRKLARLAEEKAARSAALKPEPEETK